MAEETTRGDQWLFATLSADSTLTGLVGARIFSEVAPPGSAFPFIVFALSTADDVIGATEADRIMVDAQWTILAVDETLTWVGSLQDIADRVDTLLRSSSGGTADSATVFAAHRIRPLRLLEERDGRQFRKLGGLYRLLIQR